MHTVALYRKVRLACRDGMSGRAAARHFGISCESVKKVLCFSVPPGYRRRGPVRRPKLDGFTEIIDGWLKDDLDQHRKQHHTAKRVLTGFALSMGSAMATRSRPCENSGGGGDGGLGSHDLRRSLVIWWFRRR